MPVMGTVTRNTTAKLWTFYRITHILGYIQAYLNIYLSIQINLDIKKIDVY
jgi:hypothetical protein